MRARGSWSIDQFVIAKKLGGGYASTVHLAVCKTTGIQVAAKVYHRCKLSQLNQYQVKREVRIHSCLDHPNVLKLYAAFEDEVGVYLITEYASRGDVFGELDRRGGTISEGDAVRQVLQPFMSALRYLHALNIIHRDIKPENLLINAAGELKVADFGLSIDITQERPVTRVGTLDYMAPEVVVCPDKCLPGDNKEKVHLHYTHLVDAWAVGVLAYELTVGRAPFDAGNKRATIDQILNGQPTFPAWISEQARHFITWSLTKDVKARPDVHQLAYHPWVTSHAKPRPRISPGRATSAVDLLRAPAAPGDGPPCGGTAHMEARHKALVAGHVGGGPGLGGRGPSASPDEAAAEGQGPCDWEATPATPPAAAGAAPPATASPQQQQPPAAAGTPFAAPQVQGPAAPAGPGGAADRDQQALQQQQALLQHQQQQQQQQKHGGARGILETAAESLRAYVHRCQSANNLESLRAAVLLQAPEPTNACFEPGGRFYNPKASLLQQHAARAAGGAAAAAAAAAAATSAVSGQQGAAGEQPPRSCQHPHDSVSSFGCGGSPKPSSAHPMPPLPPGAAGAARPPPLQLVRMPSPGLQHGAAAPPSLTGRADGAKQQPPHVQQRPGSPDGSKSPMPLTPEGASQPRSLVFAKTAPLAAPALLAAPASYALAGAGARSSGASGSDPMQVDVYLPGGAASDGSSCGSAAVEFMSVCGTSAKAAGSAAAAAAAPAPAVGAAAAAAASARSMVPPEPVSPPQHLARAGSGHAAAAAAGKAAAAEPGAAAAGAQKPGAATLQEEGSGGTPDSGASAHGGWFGLHCFLKSTASKVA